MDLNGCIKKEENLFKLKSNLKTSRVCFRSEEKKQNGSPFRHLFSVKHGFQRGRGEKEEDEKPLGTGCVAHGSQYTC